MTLKTAKLQIGQLQQENEQLKLLVASLEDKINTLENQLDKLKALNYIQEKYNIPGN
jgi:cell division protein FtsB